MILIVVKTVIVSLLLFLSIALILTFSESPTLSAGESLDFTRASGGVDQSEPLLSFTARDGSTLNYRHYPNDVGPLIIVIHGSSAHSGLYHALSEGLSEFGSVIVPDLRGHGGQTPTGDVAYIGQLEDDLADLIDTVKTQVDQKVILVGHSSGGGLAVRYGGNKDQTKPDGVVLLAPYLGFNAPTTRTDSGGWAVVATRRIIGLLMLNAFKIPFLNHLDVIMFRLPDNGEELKMTPSYSYRMNTSYAPRTDFKKDIARLPQFKILIGDQDEAFLANEYSPLLDSFDNAGSVEVVDDLSHLDVIADSGVHSMIGGFIELLDAEK